MIDFTFRLVGVRGGPPEEVKIRRYLKRLGRNMGLRVEWPEPAQRFAPEPTRDTPASPKRASKPLNAKEEGATDCRAVNRDGMIDAKEREMSEHGFLVSRARGAGSSPVPPPTVKEANHHE